MNDTSWRAVWNTTLRRGGSLKVNQDGAPDDPGKI